MKVQKVLSFSVILQLGIQLLKVWLELLEQLDTLTMVYWDSMTWSNLCPIPSCDADQPLIFIQYKRTSVALKFHFKPVNPSMISQPDEKNL